MAAFRDSEGRLRLNLGCGRKPKAGFLGVDAGEDTRADVRAGILEFLRELPPASVSEVYSRHVLEHLEPATLRALLGEVDRVLCAGGTMEIIVPHFSNPYYYSDPTHRQPFGLYTFSYFCQSHCLRRSVPGYVAVAGWHLASVRVHFRPYFRPALFGRRLPMPAHALNLLVNRRPVLEWFERYLAFIIPIYEISYRIEKTTG